MSCSVRCMLYAACECSYKQALLMRACFHVYLSLRYFVAGINLTAGEKLHLRMNLKKD